MNTTTRFFLNSAMRSCTRLNKEINVIAQGVFKWSRPHSSLTVKMDVLRIVGQKEGSTNYVVGDHIYTFKEDL